MFCDHSEELARKGVARKIAGTAKGIRRAHNFHIKMIKS